MLSGGERNRLLLAKTLLLGGNLLLLDEVGYIVGIVGTWILSSYTNPFHTHRQPTNDIDNATLRALEEAIAAFVGSTMVVSHDRWFLDRVATSILAFEGDSQVVYFDGSFSEYEADRRKRTGVVDPTKIKFRPMPTR